VLRIVAKTFSKTFQDWDLTTFNRSDSSDAFKVWTSFIVTIKIIFVSQQNKVDLMREIRLMALMQRTGYPSEQKEGQRLYGPPSFWQGDVPLDGCEVYVTGLPEDAYEVR